jgi:formylmethanofuran dehydrogenase subunit A
MKTKMEMVKKAGKMVPAFAADGKGKMKTGGMVNSNAKVAASKVAKGRPVKSAEPKSAAKKATGRVGGISKAPRAAAPKMKMGGSMKGK